MTESEPSRIPSVWATALEASLLVYPFASLVMLLSVATFSGSTGSQLGHMLGTRLVPILFALQLVSMLIVPLLLHFDGEKVRSADVEWSPSKILYPLLGFFFTTLVVMDYLYKRYKYAPMPADSDRWWFGVAAYLGAVVLMLVLSGVAMVGGLAMDGVGNIYALVLFALGMVLPIAIYFDSRYVRTNGGEWKPNPVNYYVLTALGFILLVLPPIASGYYLYKRRQTVGTP